MNADIELRKGLLLISNPNMLDPNFTRTVVLLCEHSDEGSLGLVLNRATSLTLDQVLPDLEDERASDVTLYSGGPVMTSHLLVLHRLGEQVVGSAPVINGIYLGGDGNSLQRVLTGRESVDGVVKFFLGYAGWGRQQLDREMQQEAWLTAPATAELVFETPPNEIWRTVLRSFGGELSLFGEMPPDPSLN